jgi:hypothetical protein
VEFRATNDETGSADRYASDLRSERLHPAHENRNGSDSPRQCGSARVEKTTGADSILFTPPFPHESAVGLIADLLDVLEREGERVSSPRTLSPLTVEDLRRLDGSLPNDEARHRLLEQLDQLTPRRRDGVLALMDMLLALRSVPEEQRNLMLMVLRFFNRLTDDQRGAYLRLSAGEGVR